MCALYGHKSYVLLIEIDSWHLFLSSSSSIEHGNQYLMGSSGHTVCTFTMCDVMSWHIDTEHQPHCVWHKYNYEYYLKAQNLLHDVAYTFSTIKSLHL